MIQTAQQWMDAGKPEGYRVNTPYGEADVLDGRKVHSWYELLVKSPQLHGWIHAEPTMPVIKK